MAENNKEEEFEKLPRVKNILMGQEGPIRRPIFEGEFGQNQKIKGYEIFDVRVKSVYCKGDQIWVKFEPLDGTDGFNVRIDNAYNQFKNTKVMTQEQIDQANWQKARNKLESPEYLQKMIHNKKDINALIEIARYGEKMEWTKETDLPTEEKEPSITQARNTKFKAKSNGVTQEQEQMI